MKVSRLSIAVRWLTIVALAIIGEECLFEISQELVRGRGVSHNGSEIYRARELWAAFNVLILVLVVGIALLAYRYIQGPGALRALFMRLPRVRFTIRRMMIAVAITGTTVGVPIVLYREGNRLVWRVERDHYRARAEESTDPAERAWCAADAAKYERLLGERPDPSGPE